MKDRLYLNIHDPNAVVVAKKCGFGIELDDCSECYKRLRSRILVFKNKTSPDFI